ncbi:hypothetical protein Tco_1319754 [Tanacetum coccineum]
MTSLADKSLLSGGDNKPPMLEKHLYDSWKSRMELYMMNRPHGRMILASVEKGPLVWPSINEDRIKLLMQGTSLTKQERECKLYDEFDKFTYKKGETLHEYYLRFTLLLNDMNIYKMPLEQFQVICTATNVDHLQFSFYINMIRHAIEVRLMHERNPDPLALVASHQLTQPTYQSHLHPHHQSLSHTDVHHFSTSQFLTPYQHQQYSTPLSITYPTNEYQSTVHHNVYSQQPSIPQLEYAPTTYQQQQPEFSQPDSSLVVPVFQKGDDPIDAINHMMSLDAYDSDCDELNSAKIALMANLSRNGSDALTEVHNQDNLNYDLFNQSEQIMTSSEQSNDVSQSETDITSDSNIIPYSQYLSETQQETV